MSRTILERVAAGEPSAVDQCFEQYRGLVWSLARRFAGNHADAEDAVQEIFIELWRHAARFDPSVASESTFVATLARPWPGISMTWAFKPWLIFSRWTAGK